MTSEELIALLEEASLEPTSYSGRGMSGKECVAVSGSSVWEVARALPEDADVPEPHTDALGRNRVIIYWPSFEWPEDHES